MNMHDVNQTIDHNDLDDKECIDQQHENYLIIFHY